jgi:hypothetical protein
MGQKGADILIFLQIMTSEIGCGLSQMVVPVSQALVCN